MTTPREFGSTLRRARERRHVTLKAIEQQTKIGASMLDALEHGDCSRWPGGIYSRAWIRAYAGAIGLDPDDTAATFAGFFPDPTQPGPTHKKIAPPAVVSSLRLSIEESPRDRWRGVSRRCLLVGAELLGIVAVAAALSFANLTSFWMTTAILSLACNAIGIASGTGSTTAWLIRTLRETRHADAPERSGESAVPEAA